MFDQRAKYCYVAILKISIQHLIKIVYVRSRYCVRAVTSFNVTNVLAVAELP